MLTGLLRSSLINGVLLYAILVAGLVSAGTVLGRVDGIPDMHF
jgi:hypothetical protein